jgi:hypothetical protein
MRLLALILAAGLALPAATAQAGTAHVRTEAPATTIAEAPIPVPASEMPPAGRRLSSDRVLEIAEALPKMRAVRRKYRGSYGGAYFKGPLRWQVSFFSAKGSKEIGQVIIADSSGRVLEQWTGFQVAWTMARGYRGAFGEHVNALYVWIPLCLLFFIPFFDWRRPFSLLHLDLLVLLSFSVSLAFFNHAQIYASVPLTYPPLLYLLARMLALLRRRTRPTRPLRLLIPAPWLALGIVSLLGFRIALNVTDAQARSSTATLSTATGRQTTNTATPTAPSTTSPTSRSSRSSAGAAPGTTCRPRTPRRSASTCSRSRSCS